MTSIFYKKILGALKGIIKGTKWEGHVYTVGGCERDLILGRDIKDIDLVIDLVNGGIRFAQWLEENGFLTGSVVVYENFGTAMFRLKDFPEVELEAVQTRKEAYRDLGSRNPDTAFGTIEDDAHRRDFACNAIYYNISKEVRETFNENSLNDINNGLIRACGEPDIIFNEDPLRILRAIRFAVTLDGFSIEDNTWQGMCRCARRLKIISNERIQEELNRMLTTERAAEAISMIFEIGADDYVIERNMFDTNGGSKKIIAALSRVHTTDLDVNLAILFAHFTDIKGKLKHLHYSNDVIKRVEKLLEVVDTMVDMDDRSDYTQIGIRKLQYECGDEDTFVAACMVFDGLFDKRIFTLKLAVATRDMVKNDIAMFRYKLPIDGNFIMKVKNIKPSKDVGKYLDFCLHLAFVYPKFTKEDFEKILMYN